MACYSKHGWQVGWWARAGEGIGPGIAGMQWDCRGELVYGSGDDTSGEQAWVVVRSMARESGVNRRKGG